MVDDSHHKTPKRRQNKKIGLNVLVLNIQIIPHWKSDLNYFFDRGHPVVLILTIVYIQYNRLTVCFEEDTGTGF